METILIVDNDQNFVGTLAGSLLPGMGFESIVAYDGNQALDVVRDNYKFLDLMLLSLELPDTTGLAILSQLAQDGRSIPTILMTSDNSGQIVLDAFRLGVQDYLLKPINEEQLRSSISRALDNARLRRTTERLTAQLKEQINWLTVLSRVGKSITSTLDIDSVLKRIVEAGVQLTHADDGFLALLDEGGTQLQMRAAKNIDEDTVKTMRLPVNDTLLGSVLQSNKPLRTSQSQGQALKVSTGYLVHSILHVPLISKGEPLGVLSVNNRLTPRPFTSADEAMLLSLADYASVALENARLYLRSQEELEERKRIEEQLRYENLHDRLTGLFNRISLVERLRFCLEKLRRHSEREFAVLFLDIDNFKNVNDSLGHMMGDQLIIAVGNMLASIVRPTDMVARLGGDEYVILVEDIEDLRDAVRISDRILTEMATTPLLPDQRLNFSASIGIVQGTTSYTNPDDILRDADIALYRAKAAGRARYEIFDPVMREHVVKRLALEAELRQAIERNEFSLHYQPMLSASDGKLLGFEALVRWQHPERGLLSPGLFIDVAEETGLIIPIDRWVLREACMQLRKWQDGITDMPPIHMSVNLSGLQITQPDLLNYVMQTVKEANIDPSLLNLEITETTVMENLARTLRVLTSIKEFGVQVQVDDFGVGYSSLSYLSRFPMDALKIDQSFVSNMEVNDTNTRIVQAIVMMTHGLGIQVVAEGVETKAQFHQLREMGCEFVQGYLIAKPLDKDKTEQLLHLLYSEQGDAPWDIYIQKEEA
jgi:diguanylate cyclase (GGDEF)-like protein